MDPNLVTQYLLAYTTGIFVIILYTMIRPAFRSRNRLDWSFVWGRLSMILIMAYAILWRSVGFNPWLSFAFWLNFGLAESWVVYCLVTERYDTRALMHRIINKFRRGNKHVYR